MADEKSLKNIVLVVYILQAAGFLTSGVTWLIGIIVNYVKKDDATGTWLESHFRWQIRTFWFGLAWSIFGPLGVAVLGWALGWMMGGAEGAGWLTAGGLIAGAVAIAVVIAIWAIYRIAKGWLRLIDGKPMYA